MKIGFLSHLDWNLYLFRLPIMRKLREEGWQVYAIAPRGEYTKRFAEFGITHIDYAIDRSSLNPLKELQAIINIYRAIVPLDLDILHTFTVKPNIYGTIAGRWAKIPHILNLVEGLGSYYVEESFKASIVRGVMERLYKIAFSLSEKAVFVNSDDPRYMIQKRIIPPQKVAIIKSVGINTDMFDPSKVKRAPLRSDKPVVMMVGRAIWHKGVREFYEAARMLAHKATFVYVGGTYSDNPSAVPEDFLHKPYVTYLGHRDDIKELIAACDIFVLPSYREGLPRTLLEASALAKPLVATDTVGCKDVVQDGYNGFLVPVKDSETLAKKIEQLIDDPAKRQTFGQNARELVVKNFALPKVVDAYIRLYREVCDV